MGHRLKDRLNNDFINVLLTDGGDLLNRFMFYEARDYFDDGGKIFRVTPDELPGLEILNMFPKENGSTFAGCAPSPAMGGSGTITVATAVRDMLSNGNKTIIF